MDRRGARIIALLLINLVIAGPAAHAEQDRVRRIASSFADAPVVLHVRDAANLRQSEQYELARASLEVLVSFDAVGESWASLSKSLRWTEEQTFDHLLGKSVAIVVESVDRPDAWTVISEVSPRTVRHISAKLRAVPRANIGGTPIVGVEGQSLAAAMVTQDEMSLLILTRNRRTASFERAVRLAQSKDHARLAIHLPAGDIALALRGYPTPDTNLAAGATQRPSGWSISTKLRSATISEQLAQDIAPWSPPEPSTSDELLLEMHLPLSQVSALDLSRGIDTQVRDDRPGLDEFGPTISVYARPSETEDLTITLAVPAKGRFRSASKGDAIISALVSRLGQGQRAPPNFEGLYPDALRVVRNAPGLEPYVRDRAHVAWTYPQADSNANFMVIDAAATCQAARASDRIRTASQWASTASRTPKRRYASTGWLRVGEAIDQAPFLRELILRGRSVPPILRAMERVSWRIWREGDLIRGEFELEMLPS